MTARLAVLLLGAATACAAPQPWPARPSLAGQRRAVLPIVDPFMSEALYVGGSLIGADGTVFQESFVVDSGATISVIREPLLGRLRLEPRTSAGVATVDAAGRTQRLRSVLVPGLRLGELEVRELAAATIGSDNLIGDDVLGQLPWEVDLDRATVTLGAAPWPEGAALARVPLQQLPPDAQAGPRVMVRLDGQEAAMTLDTGASRSALPARLAAVLSLSPPKGAVEPVYFGAAQTLREATSVVAADLAIGRARIGLRTFLLLSDGAWDRGLLGLDVLRRFVFRVEPGRWLELRARDGVETTTAARVARWPWVPHCPPPGCATARLEGRGEATLIAMTLHATYRREPTSFMWRCPGARGPNVITVFLPEATAGRTYRLRPSLASPGWAAALPRACRTLALIDVNPAGLAVTRTGPVAAVLAMSE